MSASRDPGSKADLLWQTGAAIFAGTISEMDDPRRLKARSLATMGPVPAVTRAASAITDNLIRLPHLALMVRQISERQNDMRHAVATLALAKDIFHVPIRREIETLIDGSITSSESPNHPLGSSLFYTAPDVYAVTTFYCMWLIVTSSLVQRILDQVEPTLSEFYFDRGEVEAEDVRCAERIAMSTEYAFQETTTPPFNAMRIVTPLTVSYGTWDRLDKRTQGKGGDTTSHAANMKAFVLQSFNYGMALWNLGASRPETMERLCEAYSGGRTLPEVSRKQNTS